MNFNFEASPMLSITKVVEAKIDQTGLFTSC